MLHLKTFRTRSIGWALFGVNFRPLQDIEAIMGGGQIFDTGPFFARLRYSHSGTEGTGSSCFVHATLITQICTCTLNAERSLKACTVAYNNTHSCSTSHDQSLT